MSISSSMAHGVRPSLAPGTEDYFNGGWYFEKGAFSTPTHGAPGFDGGPFTAYRFHLSDWVPFDSSLRVAIQHGGKDDNSPPYSSVAYYYLNAKERIAQTDAIDFSDADSVTKHGYSNDEQTASGPLSAQFCVQRRRGRAHVHRKCI